MKKIVITAGGGGHFAAALGVIDALPQDWDVLVVGRKHTFEGEKTISLESQTAQKRGIPFIPITTGRLQRRLSRHTLASLLRTPVGLAQSLRLLRQYKPDVVVSFGGYVSVPVVFAAFLLRIPIVVHEQTLHAGLANKLVAPLADAICVSWDASLKHFPRHKTRVTGSPIRKEFLEIATRQTVSEQEPLIYITGGSGGAHALNVLIEGCLERLLHHALIVHQTGDASEFNDYDRLEQKRSSLSPELQKRYILSKFIEPSKVAELMAQASLVIARSGMGTVTELLLLGTPSLFIPLPYGQKHEQLDNARFFARTGLGEIADQKTLTSDTLYIRAKTMLEQREMYKKHAEEARKLVHSEAAAKIIEHIIYVTQQKSVKKA